MGPRRLPPVYRCGRCGYQEPFTCPDCGEGFPSSRHLSAHKRYQHGVGYRKPSDDPVPDPVRPTPAYLAEQLVPVSDAVLALPKVRFPFDELTVGQLRARLELAIEPDLDSMTEREQIFWRSLGAYLEAAPRAIAHQRLVEENATRQKLRAKGLQI